MRHNNAGPRGSCGAVGLDTFGFGSFMTALHSTPPHSMHRRRPARWLPFGLGALEVAQQVVEVVGGEIATAQVTSVAFDARPGRPILRFFFHGGWESRQPSGPAALLVLLPLCDAGMSHCCATSVQVHRLLSTSSSVSGLTAQGFCPFDCCPRGMGWMALVGCVGW